MNKDEFIKIIEKDSKYYESGVRQERASFLVWFLVNYFKLEEEDALSFVCDSPNDKGIDGIFVDDVNQEIYILQSKYSPNFKSAQGDNDLRNFVGASSWFDSQDNISKLDNSFASNDLKSLVKRVKIFDALESNYDIYLVYVTNKIFDAHGRDFLNINGEKIVPYDFDRLFKEYIYTGKDKPVMDTFSFDYDSNNIIKGNIGGDLEYYIFPAKVADIVRLKGIQDKTLFSKNVRFSLGRTRVNKEIRKTILKPDEHKFIVLYNNGLTVLADQILLEDDKIKLVNYSIVNGCQSTVTFYENGDKLSDEMEVLIKVIKTDENTNLSEKVTFYTNNQNSISIKDLKSNDKVQCDIQIQFTELFGNDLYYQIKRGESVSEYKNVISNDFAAQIITAFYLKEPHTTHQKTKIFSDKYTQVFNKNINAQYIFLLYAMYKAIEANIEKIEHEGVRTYKTTKFFFLYVLRLIFEKGSEGKLLIKNPAKFYDNYKSKNLSEKFGKLFCVIVPDFNFHIAEIIEKNQFYDYKNELRNIEKVREFGGRLVADYQRAISRHQEDSFESILEN